MPTETSRPKRALWISVGTVLSLLVGVVLALGLGPPDVGGPADRNAQEPPPAEAQVETG